MKHYAHVEIGIARPPEEVFDFLADVTNNPRWLKGMRSCVFTTPPPVGKGSRYDQVASFLGREIRTTFEVVEFEPGRLVTIDTVKGPFPIKVTRRVDPAGGGSHVTEDVWGDAGGFYRVAAPALRRMVQASVTRDYGRLKQLLEQGS